MEAIGSFNESVKKQNETWNTISQSYASKASESLRPDEQNKEFRQIMREQRNEELVQQRAREARAKNIITHSFPESFGANEEKEADSNRIVN